MRLGFEEEGVHCAGMLPDTQIKVLVLSNHSVLIIGDGVTDYFNRFYCFESAAETCIRALKTA